MNCQWTWIQNSKEPGYKRIKNNGNNIIIFLFLSHSHLLLDVKSVAISVASVPPSTGTWKNTLQRPTTTTPASSVRRGLKRWTVLNSTSWRAIQTNRQPEGCWTTGRLPVKTCLVGRLLVWLVIWTACHMGQNSCAGHKLFQSTGSKSFEHVYYKLENTIDKVSSWHLP